jgi:hypothetical protein
LPIEKGKKREKLVKRKKDRGTTYSSKIRKEI